MHAKRFFIIILVMFLSLAVSANAEEELKIVYNTSVAPLKFVDESGRPAGLLPEQWRLWAAKTRLMKTVSERLRSIGPGEREGLEKSGFSPD